MTGLTKSYRDTLAVDSLSLDVGAEEIVAILGPSGCGKTTTLRSIAGFVRPDAGEIALGGQMVFGPGIDVPAARRGVGVVFQHLALFPHMSVARNVGFGVAKSARRERVGEMLALVGLDGYERRFPRQLSGGQQQRVALARALAPGPRLLCLDEPFSDLDADLRAQLRTEVRKTIKASGTPTIFVTHDQQEAMSVSDRVAVMHDGRLRQVAEPESLYLRPADPWVARFVGEGELIPVRIDGEVLFSALGKAHWPELQNGPQGNCTMLVRPEWIRVGEGSEAEHKGIIEEVDYRGSAYRTTVRLEDFEGRPGRLVLELTSDQAGRPGDHIPLVLAVHHPVVYQASEM